LQPLTLLQLGVISLFVHSEDAVVVGAHRGETGGGARRKKRLEKERERERA